MKNTDKIEVTETSLRQGEMILFDFEWVLTISRYIYQKPGVMRRSSVQPEELHLAVGVVQA